MARKVFVSSDMAVDERLSEVAEECPMAALIWPWLLTTFDDWGRAEVSPRRLKATMFPMIDTVTPAIIEEAIALFARVGLVEVYESDKRRYMAVPAAKWFRYQTHIHGSKRSKDESRHPAPPSWAAYQGGDADETASVTGAKPVAQPAPAQAAPAQPLPAPPVPPSNDSSSRDSARFRDGSRDIAENRGTPRDIAEPRGESRDRYASPSPSPSPSVYTDDREGMQGESADRPGPVGRSVMDKNAPEGSGLEREAPPSGTSSVSRSAGAPRRGPETPSERAQFIAATLSAHPEWREPLELRLAEAKPNEPDKWRAAVLRNWLAGDGTPVVDVPDADGYDAPYHRPAQINPAALEREMERKRLREETARSQGSRADLSRGALLRFAQTGMLPGAVPAFGMPA